MLKEIAFHLAEPAVKSQLDLLLQSLARSILSSTSSAGKRGPAPSPLFPADPGLHLKVTATSVRKTIPADCLFLSLSSGSNFVLSVLLEMSDICLAAISEGNIRDLTPDSTILDATLRYLLAKADLMLSIH